MAKKMHTREKRRRGLPSHRAYSWTHSFAKTRGEKTFKSEESANKWAEENKIKDFELVKVKKNKKFAVRKKE
jgi:hypothetical protein